jgi:hypothetical protein
MHAIVLAIITTIGDIDARLDSNVRRSEGAAARRNESHFQNAALAFRHLEKEETMNVKILSRAALFLAAAGVVIAGAARAQPAATGVGYSPGKTFDELSWSRFVDVVKPAPSPNLNGPLTFETWATDVDTFGTVPPVWPGSTALVAHNEHRFQASRLALARAHMPPGLAAVNGVAAACAQPGNPAAGNFPTPFTATPPTNCIAEEVRRNRASFDYIVANGLYSQAGLQAAYASSNVIKFPKPSIEIKIDWAPVATVVTWLNQNGVKVNGAPVTAAFVTQNYYITTQSGVPYAFLSMHISTKDRPDWLWVTFEHRLNPGRCDYMGCYDKFGVPPSLASIPPKSTLNTQYPDCTKSAELKTMFSHGSLSAVWDNYCLKETQIDFLSTQPSTRGRPILDGDSVIEGIMADVPILQSSCITCHAYATFGSTGCVNFSNNTGLTPPFPIGKVTPQPGEKKYDFVWGLITINDTRPC